jgi:AP-1 complex subunit mu
VADALTDRTRQTLLARNYRGDIPMSAVEKFPILLSEAEEESSAVPPCFSDEGINVCQNGFYLLICTDEYDSTYISDITTSTS